jgi:NAD-dependent dihydropyrimidine dehydrogenase PreA subunit
MAVNYLIPEFEVVRNHDRCITCRVCERQCANEVHSFDEEGHVMISDEAKCVDCQRCVSLCPTHALKIVKNDCAFRENANWQSDTIKEIYKQASSGGVLLSSMGNPKPLPVYWDKILINASQVTNPSIDPLREPMETKVFLGKKNVPVERNEDGSLKDNLPPQLELSMPVMFSAMSYGSISYNAHESLARAARELGILYNTGEGGLHEDFYCYGDNTVVQVASGRFGVHEEYLKAGAAVEIKMGQGAKPGIGGHLPGAKIVGDVSKTRMIPEGSDAISPAPHHDIYSIEDLRQLVFHRVKPLKGRHKGGGAGADAKAVIIKNLSRRKNDLFFLHVDFFGPFAVKHGAALLFIKAVGTVFNALKVGFALEIIGNEGTAVDVMILCGNYGYKSLAVGGAYAFDCSDGGGAIADNYIFFHFRHLSSKTIALLGQPATQAGEPALFLVQSSHF